MLIDLKITNGTLELKYNEYTYEYTVTVDNDINNLEFSYKLQDDCYVEIRNNELSNYENIVYLDVYNIDELITYTFYVYKENSNEANSIENFKESLEISLNKDIEEYKVQILSISIFLIIIIIFSLMFKRKKI